MFKAYVVRSKTFLPKFIRWFTNSYWDHMMIASNDVVIEQLPEGHKMWSKHEYVNLVEDLRELNLPELEDNKVHRWYAQNADKKYDWVRTLTWPIRKIFKLNVGNKWNCVEQVRAAYLFCEKQPYGPNNKSPQQVVDEVGFKKDLLID